MSTKNYAILRTAKYKSNAHINGLIRHHNRDEGIKIKGVDPTRTHLNQVMGGTSKKEIFDNIRTRIATADKKPRPDANRLMEYMVTASPEWFKSASPQTVKQYFDDAYKYAQAKHGAENVLGGWVHLDEKTPHMHIFVVPLATVEHKASKTRDAYTDVRLNAKFFTDGHACLAALQTDFHTKVGEPLGLVRGEVFSKAKHADVVAQTEMLTRLRTATTDARAKGDTYVEARLKNKASEASAEESKKHYGELIFGYDKLVASNKNHKAELEAKEKDLSEEKSRLLDEENALKKRLLAADELGILINKPKLAGMLSFLSENPDAIKVLEHMKTTPELIAGYMSAIESISGVVNVDWSNQSTDYAAMLNESYQNGPSSDWSNQR